MALETAGKALQRGGVLPQGGNRLGPEEALEVGFQIGDRVVAAAGRNAIGFNAVLDERNLQPGSWGVESVPSSQPHSRKVPKKFPD
jgi:hypothetical protein